MRITLLALLFLTTAVASAQDVNINEVGNSPVEAKFSPGGRIRMDLCASGTDITGTDEPVLRVSYSPESAGVRVRIRISGDRADISLSRCPRNNFRVRIDVPKSSALYARMMAGQLDVSEVTGDKDVEVSFGQINLDVGKPELYARIDASVNSGEIAASAFNVNKGGLFRSVDQRGPGKYTLHTHVGAGQVNLR